MLLLLVIVNTSSKAKIGLPDLCKNMTLGEPNTLQKTTLIKQKYMKRETAAQNIKNWHKSSIENEKTEELKSRLMHGQFHWDLGRPSGDKKNPWCGYVAQI